MIPFAGDVPRLDEAGNGGGRQPAAPTEDSDENQADEQRIVLLLDLDDILVLNNPFGGYDAKLALAGLGTGTGEPAEIWKQLFDAGACELLAQLHREFGPLYVLTTSWWWLFTREELAEVFERCGLSFVWNSLHADWTTPRGSRSEKRSVEIERWLHAHPDAADKWVILDDSLSGTGLGSSFQTHGGRSSSSVPKMLASQRWSTSSSALHSSCGQLRQRRPAVRHDAVHGADLPLPLHRMSCLFFKVRLAPPVQLQEILSIRQWRIARLRDGAAVLAGVTAATRVGVLTIRVSSAIAGIDPALRSIQTTSGRLYRLDGPPAQIASIRELIANRLACRGHEDALDITDLIWSELEREAQY
ncbi:hypothetical protein VAR608DRAFT_1502 [Variovorax sp. HW608]|uniref:HAD domain-containing protein n=1 Tax=Variovorax sp. HW608 TaxID=1034889 RepID=UPI00081F8510|nr:HAD domain-containing protein [Variovorax sp. HW608]SCK20300.1 hypothetical protein VAR608DRAFT_1502 [Variovorax sp. HW608]